jgi:hypothetical protein
VTVDDFAGTSDQDRKDTAEMPDVGPSAARPDPCRAGVPGERPVAAWSRADRQC